MSELRIHTQIHSRYRAFDLSGRLPFSIVFGFCRRSKDDTNPQAVLLQIAGSVLDVPYALAQGLLTLHEKDPDDVTHWIDVDLSPLSKVTPKEAGCLSLPSPVHRTGRWRDSFTVYQCPFEVSDELASILKPGKSYVIRLATQDLGVKRWAYSDGMEFSGRESGPNHDLPATRLANSKLSASNAPFKVVKCLPWPPTIVTKMALRTSSSSSDSGPASDNSNNTTFMEVSITNTGRDSITVQTRRHQPVLIPWDPFQPELEDSDDRMRIIDAAPPNPPITCLRVVDSKTGELVRGRKATGIAPLKSASADTRPKAEDLAIFKPGELVVRSLDIGRLVDGLNDGQYKIRMQPKGCRWWDGDVLKELDQDGRLPARLCRTMIPPLMVETQDEIEFHIKEGNIVQ